MAETGVIVDDDHPALSRPSATGVWKQVPLPCDQACPWLRSLLRQGPYDAYIDNIGTHSCKRRLLSTRPVWNRHSSRAVRLTLSALTAAFLGISSTVPLASLRILARSPHSAVSFTKHFAVTTNEMKMLVEAPQMKLCPVNLVPERAKRFELIRKRLSGLFIRNRLEPSDALVDALVLPYRQDRIEFLQWDRI